MAEDDKSRQEEEIEALSSIYGEDWTAIDCENGQYEVQISSQKNTVTLQIELPKDYPSTSPPHYQLSIPWLRGEERQNVDRALSDIVCENLGESVLYLWIEKIREIIEKSGSDVTQYKKDNEGDIEDDDENGFDISALELSLSTSREEQPEQESNYTRPEILHGEIFVDRRSRFLGHIARVVHTKQVKLVLDCLKENKKIAEATHNIYAYRIQDSNSFFYQGCEDDGEIQAGSRLLHLLQIIDGKNVMVIVTRWYGGIHLGPDRFKHINNCARVLLDQEGFIKSKEDKKGPKSSKKKR